MGPSLTVLPDWCRLDEAYFVSDPFLLRALRSGIV